MRLPLAILTALAFVAMPAAAKTEQCRDAHGKFIKCPPPKPKATAKPKSSSSSSGKCRNAKGQFAKCGTPGTHPA